MSMEVVNDNLHMLSNMEVLGLLRDIQGGHNGHTKPTKELQNLGTITYEAVKYLENTPAAHQAQADVVNFMTAVQDTDLTEAEKLQLLNSRPTTMVEMHLMVEESEERFPTDEEMERLRDLVVTNLPGPQPPSPPEGEEEMGEEEMEEEGEGENEEEIEEGGEEGAVEGEGGAEGGNYVAI